MSIGNEARVVKRYSPNGSLYPKDLADRQIGHRNRNRMTNNLYLLYHLVLACPAYGNVKILIKNLKYFFQKGCIKISNHKQTYHLL